MKTKNISYENINIGDVFIDEDESLHWKNGKSYFKKIKYRVVDKTRDGVPKFDKSEGLILIEDIEDPAHQPICGLWIRSDSDMFSKELYVGNINKDLEI